MRYFAVLSLFLALSAPMEAINLAQDVHPEQKTRSPLTTTSSPPSSGAGSFANDMGPGAIPPVPINVASQPQTIFPSPDLSQSDIAFLRAANQEGIFEIQVGEFAGQNGATYAVRKLGRVIAHDHRILNASLYQFAQSERLTLPFSATVRTQNRIGALTTLSGRAFDRAYVGTMRDAHRNDIAAFQDAAARTRNARLHDLLVNEALPMLRHHLALANHSYSTTKK
jgi:putative membrane protein